MIRAILRKIWVSNSKDGNLCFVISLTFLDGEPIERQVYTMGNGIYFVYLSGRLEPTETYWESNEPIEVEGIVELQIQKH